MYKKLILVVCLMGASDYSEALVRKTESSIVSGEVLTKKKNYQTSDVSAAEIQRALDEERKEKNRKVQAVMRVAKKSQLPAGLLLDTIQDGEVVQDLVDKQAENLGKWKQARRVPRDLKVPWGNLFLFCILLVIAVVSVIIHRGRKKEQARKPTF